MVENLPCHKDASEAPSCIAKTHDENGVEVHDHGRASFMGSSVRLHLTSPPSRGAVPGPGPLSASPAQRSPCRGAHRSFPCSSRAASLMLTDTSTPAPQRGARSRSSSRHSVRRSAAPLSSRSCAPLRFRPLRSLLLPLGSLCLTSSLSINQTTPRRIGNSHPVPWCRSPPRRCRPRASRRTCSTLYSPYAALTLFRSH